MTTEKRLPSWLREIKQKRCLCVRMNRLPSLHEDEQTSERMARSSENGESTGVMEVVVFPCQCEVNPLVECAYGKGLTVLPHSTPSYNYLS